MWWQVQLITGGLVAEIVRPRNIAARRDRTPRVLGICVAIDLWLWTFAVLITVFRIDWLLTKPCSSKSLSLSYVRIHSVALSAPAAHPFAFLRTLLLEPLKTRGSYLPTMPDDVLKVMLIRAQFITVQKSESASPPCFFTLLP